MIKFVEFIKAKLGFEAAQNMTEIQFLQRELTSWFNSPERQMQMDGIAYYMGNQDIDKKQRTGIGAGGSKTVYNNIPNTKILDNRYAYLVDQKANYLLAKKIDVKCDDEKAQEGLSTVFNRAFQKKLKRLGKDSLNCGISWLMPYITAANEIRFKQFHGHEILPFWSDDEHTQLDAAARVYRQEAYEGTTKKIIIRVEWYKPEGVQKFIYEAGVLKPESEGINPYIIVGDGETAEGYTWGRVPLVAFKANDCELPLIKRVKSLQDALNLLLSNCIDNMREDVRSTILVIKNYDGTDLGEFRKNLATFGVIKVRTDEGGGGVDTLRVEVNADNYDKIVSLLRKTIIENGRGLDVKSDTMAGTPNQMNIQSMYNDIDLDADDMETEYQASFEELTWFINAYFKSNGKPEVTGLNIIFNRDVLLNESETVQMCQQSKGIISNKTIVANHPWVTSAEDELKRMEKETAENNSQFMTGSYSTGEDNGTTQQ